MVQPGPRAETSGLEFPGVRFCIATPFGAVGDYVVARGTSLILTGSASGPTTLPTILGP
jgi:hypothetical protein